MLHDVLMTPKTAGFTYHSKQGEFNRCPIEIDLFSPLHFLKVIAMRPIDFSQTFISKHIVITALILIATNSLIGQNAVFISANDAKRKMPLSEAVQARCGGVSVCVKLTDEGKLECAGKSFEQTYLKPAMKMEFNANAFILVLEFEGDSLKMLGALDKLLGSYSDLLSKQVGKEEVSGKLKIYIWGDVPHLQIGKEQYRSYFPLSILDDEGARGRSSAAALGLNFDALYDWKGRESMPNMQYHSMQMNLKAAHKAGQKTFMFEAPETFNSWNILSNAGTDYFVVKDLEKFKKYLTLE